MSHAYDRFLIVEGKSYGPFSSGWAAVAALIRLHDPEFKSLGQDKPEDLAIEAIIPKERVDG